MTSHTQPRSCPTTVRAYDTTRTVVSYTCFPQHPLNPHRYTRAPTAQLLHDRVRVSPGPPVELLRPDVNVVHVRRCCPVHPRHVSRQAQELGPGFRAQVGGRRLLARGTGV